MPTVYIIAGCNGAGKTTFANTLLPQYAGCAEFVNADLIAKGLSPFNSEGVSLQAGKVMLRRLRELAEKGLDFAFETTLAGRSYLPFLRDLKTRGYILRLFFLWVPNPSTAIERVADRVAKGGHHIPPEDVRRRHSKSIQNLLQVYGQLMDHWMLFDNTDRSRLIAYWECSQLIVIDAAIYSQIKKSGGVA
ncbi:MAG: zeta toxin family protein [Planctomycetes bacterium]|nr:zeta toxin family protein [Planctomycetota bacterium]